MPRILPRLTQLALSGPFVSSPRPKTRRTPPKPASPPPSAIPADYPRSVLLSPSNIITNSHDYAHHKSAPHLDPVHARTRRRIKRKINDHDPPEMSAQERGWWSSPYLRMLASPIRQCALTGRYLPKDFLVRLAVMKVPGPLHARSNKAPFVILPDGLQHHSFKLRKSGRGMYLLCSREWLALFLRRGGYKRYGVAPPQLASHIAHLLRLRVLQELLLVAERLERLYRRERREQPAPALLRRLTRAEWGALRTTGVLPHPGALAVLVVPPVNRDPATKQRPDVGAAMSDAPLADALPLAPKRATPPLSVLHPTRACESQAEELVVAPHAEERVPLYNGVSLFPNRVQRARLHELLSRILGVEMAWRFSANTRSPPNKKGEHQDAKPNKKGENKGSHAFLVCPSDEVDMAPVGIALWRVRMWEGGGSEEKDDVF